MAFEEQVIHGRYRLLGRIGRGATSVVWQARDERLDRVVAVKQLRQDSEASLATVSDACERAIREARLASRLVHPHAITVHDVFEDIGSMYLVLEYLRSRPLTDLLIEHGPMPADEVVRLGHQIASALAAAHAAGILHHDVTPNNVLVTADGTAKITDFGVARALGDQRGTGDGVVRGTPAYLAPEVAAGGEGDFASDVYSLGATLYTALEGVPPFGTSEDPLELLRRITETEPTPPVRRGPITEVVVRMLDRDPGARPSMREVVDLLAATATPPAPATKRRRSRFRGAATSGIAACLISAAVVTGLAFTDRTETTAAPITHPPATVTADHTVQATTTAPAVSLQAAPPSLGTPSRQTDLAAPRAGCTARYEVTNSWPGGAQVLVTVHNDQPARLAGWSVSWRLPAGTGIRELWNGTLTTSGSAVNVTDAGWNALLEGNASVSFGMNLALTTGRSEVPALKCRPS